MNAASHTRLLPVRLLLLFCVAVWGSTFVATKICLSYLDPFQLVGGRFLIGLPVLTALIAFRRVALQFNSRDTPRLAAGALIVAVHFTMQAFALTLTTATNTGWIIAVTPLAIAMLSFILLRERILRHELWGIGLATLGILVLVYNGEFSHFGGMKGLGDWLILVSAHTWALYTIATRDLSRRYDPLAVTLVMAAPLALGCGFYLLVSSKFPAFLLLPPKPIAALLFLGILGILTQWFWQVGIARLGATRAGIFLYLEPIATTSLAVPLLGESPTFYVAAGGLLVLSGVALAQRFKKPELPPCASTE